MGTLDAQAATVVVVVQGAQLQSGRVFATLCSGGFDEADCANGQSAPASSPAVFTFANVTPGVYAAAAFQDLNGNGRLDRSPHGLPLEPYGFSNGAGRTSAPRFERAAFDVDTQTSVVVRLNPIASRR